MQDVDLTQLWYELKIEIETLEQESLVLKELLQIMNDMEDHLKGGSEYE